MQGIDAYAAKNNRQGTQHFGHKIAYSEFYIKPSIHLITICCQNLAGKASTSKSDKTSL